ncbi:MAG TPA: hypothetical protein VHX38_17225 [Pseudonocardiaceae bacterium]|jgi:hypothetical protein|nr:hypothetical protein [Pseudonocardiaceae bacterium]
MGKGDSKGKGKKNAKAKAKAKARRTVPRKLKPGGRSGQREAVPADLRGFFDGDGPDGDGSAGVREPRNPKPLPQSSSGERPMPHPEFALSVADPRH